MVTHNEEISKMSDRVIRFRNDKKENQYKLIVKPTL